MRRRVSVDPDVVQDQINTFFNVSVAKMMSIVPPSSMRLVLSQSDVVHDALMAVADGGYCVVPGDARVGLPSSSMYHILNRCDEWVVGMFPPNKVTRYTLIAKGTPTVRAKTNWIACKSETRFVRDLVLMLTHEGDSVLALEVGVCGALLACICGNRRFYGCESDTKRYYDTIERVMSACSARREED